MIQIMWCCVGMNFKDSSYYDTDTLSYTRTTSIKKLLNGSDWKWAKYRRKGWRCVQVEITINKP